MASDITLLGSYSGTETPLRSGGRRDVEVTPTDANLPVAFDQTDVVDTLRRFFDALDREAESHRGDPVALAQALARMEALLADVRSVRDTIRSMCASALADERVRRLTVRGVTTVESTTEVKRSGWRHDELLADLMNGAGISLIETSTGELFGPVEGAEWLLQWFRPEWRMTPIRAAGLYPDNYCDVATDDDGTPLREPAVRIIDNTMRKVG